MAEPTELDGQAADLSADSAEQASGYPGPPVTANPLSEQTARRARLGGVLSAVGTILQSLGGHLVESAHDEARELVDLAYRHGHRHGWYERGEHIDQGPGDGTQATA